VAVPVYHHGSVFAEYCELVDEERLTKELVLKFLHMACTRRVSRGKMIFHSDRGSQYASSDFRAVLAGDGFRTSMSGKGNCYDNAHAESFFHVKIAICQRKKYLRYEINRDSKKLRFIERMLFYGFLGYTNGYNRHFMHEW
jgi:transposase InsO family protein